MKKAQPKESLRAAIIGEPRMGRCGPGGDARSAWSHACREQGLEGPKGLEGRPLRLLSSCGVEEL